MLPLVAKLEIAGGDADMATAPDILQGRTDNFNTGVLPVKSAQASSRTGRVWRGVDGGRFYRSHWSTLCPTDRERPFLTEPGKPPSPISCLGSVHALSMMRGHDFPSPSYSGVYLT